jgi:alpha-amylase/alpha-mannosidase (GH57 family)
LLYLSVHGHFYQPPRENPFTGEIPQEVGAEPFHDWNERISFECYEPMAALGNFDRMSFNIGPTLAMWLEKQRPATYERILEADRENVRENGVGNAIAQAYNHTILPLANRRDKITQIVWGLEDFKYRFGRESEALWLAECTVDLETLDALAECGVKYVILAEWQALRREVDTSQPYVVRTPNGRSIVVFFFHGALAWNIHNPALTDADLFARYSLPLTVYRPKNTRQEDQLALSACDGEYFGHHYKGRAHFLADLLSKFAPAYGWKVAYPGLYLRDHPPVGEIKIAERTAWSCFHGLSRWESRCECEKEDFAAGTPQWKGSLRQALDNLAAKLDEAYEQGSVGLLADPWATRNRYIEVILGKLSLTEFVQRDIGREAAAQEVGKVENLLLSQFFRQWMYTSCGWFFEDLSRIEPKNDIAYAARAIDYVKQAGGPDLESGFLKDLAEAQSWRTGQNGAQLYEEILIGVDVIK